MNKILSINDIIQNNLCISCGACCYKGQHAIGYMSENLKTGMYQPIFYNLETGDVDVCPAIGYPIITMANNLFNHQDNLDIDLGRWLDIRAAKAIDTRLLSNAASGGIMTLIASYLIESKQVDGAIVTTIDYKNGIPRPKSIIATSKQDLFKAQGSKYCPVPIFTIIPKLLKNKTRVVFIGTPCQIAAVTLMKTKYPEINELIPITIGNFCGGFRDLRETDAIIKRAGLINGEIKFFRYRGDGQPGMMTIIDVNNKIKKINYPDYSKATGFPKHLRCRLCVDATAELADFSCGDAWIPHFLTSGKPWSILITRSKRAIDILNSIRNEGIIESQEISVSELKQSQRGNILSKKYRQQGRLHLYNILHIKTPVITEGFHANNKNIMLELKVHITHCIFSILEKLKIYIFFAKCIKRYPKL